MRFNCLNHSHFRREEKSLCGSVLYSHGIQHPVLVMTNSFVYRLSCGAKSSCVLAEPDEKPFLYRSERVIGVLSVKCPVCVQHRL